MDSSPPMRLRRRPVAPALQTAPIAPIAPIEPPGPSCCESSAVLTDVTPSHLRELEAGWRARRKRVLDGRTTEHDGKENRDEQIRQSRRGEPVGKHSVV
jgi:hypothetical protein